MWMQEVREQRLNDQTVVTLGTVWLWSMASLKKILHSLNWKRMCIHLLNAHNNTTCTYMELYIKMGGLKVWDYFPIQTFLIHIGTHLFYIYFFCIFNSLPLLELVRGALNPACLMYLFLCTGLIGNVLPLLSDCCESGLWFVCANERETSLKCDCTVKVHWKDQVLKITTMSHVTSVAYWMHLRSTHEINS